MNCPRLDHFVRLNPNGTVSRCGHMTKPPQFQTLAELNDSQWLKNVKSMFGKGQWPAECQRCRQTEELHNTSIRLHAIELDNKETVEDYLQVGGVLDNICNAACLTCSPDCSTRIGSLHGKVFPIVNNTDRLKQLPAEKIIHLDINGGEPSYSKNYKSLLSNLPPNLKTLRLNTNCNTVLTEITDIANRGIEVTVTVSLDGIGPIHDLIRWPIKWEVFYKNLLTYTSMPVKVNLWTTVSVLNVDNLPDIIKFAADHKIDHSYAYLRHPFELCVDNKNQQQVQEYIQELKRIRGIL